jgi:hypothetical protein
MGLIQDLHALHRYIDISLSGQRITYCKHCSELDGGDWVMWPCRTMKIVLGYEEGK